VSTDTTFVPNMKTKFTTAASLLATLTVIGAFATASFAGPGPQFWRPVTKAAIAPAGANGCTMCKIETVREYAPVLPNGRSTPRWTEIGTTHACSGCKGTVTTVRGKTTDTMDRTSGACGQAAMKCCL
jgi:hypothetical protein